MESTAQRRSSELRELDRVTLERAKRRDEAACRALVVRYQRPVFALLSRFLVAADAALIEDLAQETFLRVFRELPKFDYRGSARLSTWILTIATRLAIDEQRRKGRQPAMVDVAELEPGGAPRPDKEAEGRILGEAVKRAVWQLSPQLRAVFVLRAYHDCSYSEIAEALDCDVGTVKSRLSRCKDRLRAMLDGGGRGD